MADDREPMDVDLGACLDGDQQAWSAFVARCSPVIYAAIRRTIGSRGPGFDRDHSDIMQEVFVRLIRNDGRLLRSYDPARSKLATWLSLVGRSVAIDALRKRRFDTVPLQADDEAGGAAHQADQGAAEEVESDPMAPELPWHLLTARQRLVLRLLFDDDRTVPEAATILGVDEQTVRSTKHKALTRFREHLKHDGAASSSIGELLGRSKEACS